MYKRQGTYVCNVLANNGPYGANQIDFVAAYVIPADLWYIIPAHAFQRQCHVHLSPHLKVSKYARYREAWHLLRAQPSKPHAK
jgi:hypothetical protein